MLAMSITALLRRRTSIPRIIGSSEPSTTELSHSVVTALPSMVRKVTGQRTASYAYSVPFPTPFSGIGFANCLVVGNRPEELAASIASRSLRLPEMLPGAPVSSRMLGPRFELVPRCRPFAYTGIADCSVQFSRVQTNVCEGSFELFLGAPPSGNGLAVPSFATRGFSLLGR